MIQNLYNCLCVAESKSKRVSLKKKYKIIKKVKEHHKKKAKEAKKLGLNRKPKVEKDPGIPNDWPFKEQELKALEARRARAMEELEQKKAARKERVGILIVIIVFSGERIRNLTTFFFQNRYSFLCLLFNYWMELS